MKDELLEGIGRRVRRRRLERGWTLRSLASRSGLSTRFISQVEAGQGNIAIGRLAGLAAALEMTVGALIEGRSDARVALDALLAGRTEAELAQARAAMESLFAVEQEEILVLVGMRGAGKSSVGARLAVSRGVAFVELDAHVEETAGLTVGEIFALHGEQFYRRLELRSLRAVVDSGAAAIVAVSGGIVTDEEAWSVLRTSCTTIWLRASPEEHMNRVIAQGDRRPMANSEDAMAELRAILAARSPRYALASRSVDTSGRSLAEVTEDIEAWLQGR
jgi:XRE family aerobic/anaerobic benzoate catabolism transcriptional regulator